MVLNQSGVRFKNPLPIPIFASFFRKLTSWYLSRESVVRLFNRKKALCVYACASRLGKHKLNMSVFIFFISVCLCRVDWLALFAPFCLFIVRLRPNRKALTHLKEGETLLSNHGYPCTNCWLLSSYKLDLARRRKRPSFARLLSAGSASAPVCKALSSKRSNGSCPIHTTVGLKGMSSGWWILPRIGILYFLGFREVS